MREFSKSEKKIMKQIDALKKGSFGNFQSSLLIKNNIDFFAVRWDESGVYIYSKNKSADEDFKTFCELCDILYFLEELEHCNFIRVQSLITDVNSVTTYHDKYISPENYEYDTEMNQFYLRGGNILKFSSQSIDNTRTDIINLLDKYAYCKFIYPLPSLKDYIKNKFKTTEQRNFRKQLCETRIALIVALIPALLGIYQFYTDISLKEINDTIKGKEKYMGSNTSAKEINDTVKPIVINEKPILNAKTRNK